MEDLRDSHRQNLSLHFVRIWRPAAGPTRIVGTSAAFKLIRAAGYLLTPPMHAATSRAM